MNRSIAYLGCVLTAVSLAACSPSTEGTSEGSSSSTSSMAAVVSSQASSAAPVAVSSKSGNARIITVLADNWTFNPSQINVKKGEKVTLVFQGTEGGHGVMIADLGINIIVPEGKTVSVDLPTDKAGTFAFRCSVPCGPGHKEMKGSIVIE